MADLKSDSDVPRRMVVNCILCLNFTVVWSRNSIIFVIYFVMYGHIPRVTATN